MLSVVFYGRNDSYGYNLHKRVAISLNTTAELLTHENDEILFVDYNTHNDFPTLPEAIQDTLTEKAKKLLRIFRVRPEIHNKLYSGKTHLKVLEPICRNVALRRSNKKNKWILNSNTDMVFIPRVKDKSLSDIVHNLSDGFYGIPRFEMPESLWESVDRKEPSEIIKNFKHWGKRFHINDVVYGNETILFDGPGDFQLGLREDLFNIDAFDESMIKGWHVDSNLAKRMQLYGKKTQSLLDVLYGYHCDHTKQETLMHSSKSTENSFDDYFYHVNTPYIKQQHNTWGLKDSELEEVNSNSNQIYKEVLEKLLPENKKEYIESYFNVNNFDTINYDSYHVLPYLSDLLFYQKKQDVIYVGNNEKTIDLLDKLCKTLKLNFLESSYNKIQNLKSLSKSKAIFIFDFSISDSKISTNLTFDRIPKQKLLAIENILYAYLNLMRFEQKKHSTNRNKVICINTMNTRFHQSIESTLNSTKIPYSARIKHGTFLDGIPLGIKFLQYHLELVARYVHKKTFVSNKYFILKSIYKWSGLKWILSL